MKHPPLKNGLYTLTGILFCLVLLASVNTLHAAPVLQGTPTPDPFCKNDFVVPDGKGGLKCNGAGAAYKFVGVNMRELAYLPEKGSKQNPRQADQSIERQLIAASKMGVKVIRIYAPYIEYPIDDVKKSLDRLFAHTDALIQSRAIQEIKYLVSLNDFYFNSDNTYKYNADCPYYSDTPPSLDGPQCYFQKRDPNQADVVGLVLKPLWFSQGYKDSKLGPAPDHSQPYLWFVQELARYYKNNSRVFAWDLGNELAVVNDTGTPIPTPTPSNYSPTRVMQKFISDAACAIHRQDPNHMVASGFISTYHATNGQRSDPGELYDLTCQDLGEIAALDLGTIHVYNNEWSKPVDPAGNNPGDRLEQYKDYKWFQEHQVPYIVEELGFTGALADGNKTDPCRPPGDTSIPFPGDFWKTDSSAGDGTFPQLTDLFLPDGRVTRSDAISSTIDRFLDELGASGVMQWAFQAGSTELPLQDACRGMDSQQHRDWRDLYKAYCEKAHQLDHIQSPCPTIVLQNFPPDEILDWISNVKSQILDQEREWMIVTFVALVAIMVFVRTRRGGRTRGQ